MIKKFLLCLLALLAVFYGCSKSEKTRQTKAVQKKDQTEHLTLQALKKEITDLLNKANEYSDSGDFSRALPIVRRLVVLSQQVPDKLKFQYKVLDFQHFLLLKNGLYAEALDNGFKLEALGQKLEERKSPWDCLKIADAYLGLKDSEKALDWIEKAVKERDFTKIDTLKQSDYIPLQKNPRFTTLLEDIEKTLGIGGPAKDFTVTLLDGQPFTLSAQKGKVVLIDFWDVICPPCRKALPHLKELHQKFAAKGLVILGISLDTDRKLLEDYLKETQLPWAMACSFSGWNDETARLYKISATPSTYLIDRQGILRHINLKKEELSMAIGKLL